MVLETSGTLQMLAKLAPEAEARPQGRLGGDDLWAGRVWCPAMALSVDIRVLERNAGCANLVPCPNLAFYWYQLPGVLLIN